MTILAVEDDPPLKAGEAHVGAFLGADDAVTRNLRGAIERLDAERRKHMSPAGSLGLPELLDKRRLEYGIVDEAFRVARGATFDTVYVAQIDMEGHAETFGPESMLVKPSMVAARTKNEAHRGILLGAGLSAMDVLHSNGVELGHIVHFIQLAPFRQRVATIGGHDEHIIVLQAGDIRASEDLGAALMSGAASITRFAMQDGSQEHRVSVFGGPSGVKPSRANMPGDY